MFHDPVLAVLSGWIIIQTLAAVWLGWICIRSAKEEARQEARQD